MRGFGDEQRRAQGLEQVGRALFQAIEQRFDFQQAEHVGIAAAVDRIARIRRLAHLGQVLLERSVGVQPDDAGARGHDALDRAVAQAHHPLHHVAFVVVDESLLVAFAHQQLDFLFGDRVAGVVADAEHAQHAAVDRAQRGDRRFGRAGQQVQRDGDPAGDALGIGQRQPLGHQLAEDHRTGRDQAHRGSDADRAGVFVEGRDRIAEPVGDRQADGFAAEDAVQHADQGDADLDRRQQAVRVFGQGQRLARAPAVLAHLLQPHLARGHQRHFRQREEPVQQD